MTTSLSPVTETEMNNFFDNFITGLHEFKQRIATNLVALSEQAATISDLRSIVERLQNSVDAMTNTVRQLTEDRDRSERDCAKAREGEAIALEYAANAEHEAATIKAQVAEMATTIQTLQEAKFQLEISNAELREQNERQTFSLQGAVNDNQQLQSIIDQDRNDFSALRAAHNNELATNKRLQDELKRLTNMLSVAKTVLEGVPMPEHSQPIAFVRTGGDPQI